MLDSMIQMQLQTQERLKEAVCKVDKQSDAGRKESFMERMERIRRRNREQRRALDRQFIEKRLAEQESNEKRGAMLILARSGGGRLPISADIKNKKLPPT